jgi:uncharacterized protein (TIGR03437 family)
VRLFPAAILALAISCCAFGQTYTIQTFAGGGLPVNIPGTSASLRYPYFAAVDGAGNLFFADGHNIVLRLDVTTGVLTLVAGTGTPGYSGDNGPATSAQLSGPAGVAVDSSGNLYIADSGNTRIRKVSNGVITTVAGGGTGCPQQTDPVGDGCPATSVDLNSASGVALDSAGNLYIADVGNNRIRKVSNGVITTVAGNGAGGYSGDNGPAIGAELWGPVGVVVDSAGNLYIADKGNSRIRKVSNGVITTVAGNGSQGYSGDNGLATSAQLAGPGGVALDSAGSLYIADTYNNRIRKVSNGVIATVAGNGAWGYSGDNGLAASAQFARPGGVAVDLAGNLYIADTDNNCIRKVSNGVIATVAGGGSVLGDNGPSTGAQLYNPSGVALDAVGNLYIADSANNRIRKVSNGVITTVAGNGTLGYSGDNGPATSAQLALPGGVALDSAGSLYIADTYYGLIRKVSNGVIATVAGNGGIVLGDNGPATSAELEHPSGVAVDAAGTLYIADMHSNRIRKVSNGVITTVAGNGTEGFSGDNGPATSAQLDLPSGIAVNAAGDLYIADLNNQRIRKVSNGVITTVAGNGAWGYGNGGFSGDRGPATTAQLYNPDGVAVDSAGNLYIADLGNERIRKVSNGVITTVAGNGTGSYSGDSGPATSAGLNGPSSVAMDSTGNLYIADASNDRIRVLIPSGPSCSASATPTAFSPAASGGILSVTIQTSSSCAWAVQSLPQWITYSGGAVATGPATITLAVAANSGAARSAVISVAGVSIPVSQAGTAGASPSITPGGVVNDASYNAPVAPGSIAAAFGDFLLASPVTDNSSPLLTSLSGLSLQFGNGLLAPLFFANVGQVNFQVPWELAGQSQTTLAASLSSQTSTAQTVSLAPFAPAIFSTNAQGAGQGAILNSSYVLADSSNPATAGSTYLLIYCTGLGAVTNQPATGSPALSSPLSWTTTTPTVTIGGVPAAGLQFYGLAPGYAGLYQVNALVPAASTKGNAVPVTMSIGGATSNTVTIAVK